MKPGSLLSMLFVLSCSSSLLSQDTTADSRVIESMVREVLQIQNTGASSRATQIEDRFKRRMDLDGDGKLSSAERARAKRVWEQMHKNHPLEMRRVQRIMDRRANNGDGGGLFDRASNSANVQGRRTTAAPRLNRMDRNDDGSVGPREAAAANRARSSRDHRGQIFHADRGGERSGASRPTTRNQTRGQILEGIQPLGRRRAPAQSSPSRSGSAAGGSATTSGGPPAPQVPGLGVAPAPQTPSRDSSSGN